MEGKKLMPRRRLISEITKKSVGWEIICLGEIADITKLAGFEFTQHVTYSDEGEIIALRGLNVKNNKLILDDVKYIDKSNFSKLNRSKLFKNDILFTYVGTIGELAIIPLNDKYYLAPNVARIRVKEQYDANFLVQLMGNDIFYNRIIFPLIATSSQPALSMENIRKFEVTIPSYIEQQKIGAFFKVLDERIANQERKIAKVKALKDAYLTEMFPQEGKTVPKRRFKGFEEEWYNKTLGDFGTVEMNKRIFKDQTSIVGDVPFYKIGTFCKKADSFISYELFHEYKNKYPYPEPGDILISAAGSIGRTIEYQGEDAYYQDSNIVWLKHDGKLSNLFLKQFYNFTNWSSLEGSTIKRLYNRDILEATIQVPSSIEEQQKIGTFFKNLDDQIATEEAKLDKLKQTKEAYLEEMFV